MSSTSFTIAGVIRPPRELDLTIAAKLFQTSIGGAILVSRKGDEDNRFFTRVENFDQEYGIPDPTWSYGHYCIRKFLTKGEGCWIRRISRNARHAASVVYNDLSGAQGSTTYFKAIASGRYENYKTGSQQLLNFKLSAALVTGNTITVEFADNDQEEDVVTVTQTYVDSNDKTLENLAANLTTAINNNYAVNGKAPGIAYVNKIGASTENDRVLTVIAPEDINLYFTEFDVVGGASQAIASMSRNNTLMEVYAKDRGKWGSNIGYKLVNSANGINQRLTVTFDRAIVANQAINFRIYAKNSITNQETDVTLSATPFDTTHVKTVQNLMAKIKSALGSVSDVFLNDGSGLQFTIVSPSDGPNTIAVPAYEVVNTSGNAVKPVVTVLEAMAGVDNDQTFDIQIYTRDNINEFVETRTVSFLKQVNANGEQLYIEDVINTNSTSRSDYIRIKYNSDNAAGILNIPADGTDIIWLAGGDDGILPTTGDIVLAWDQFKSRQKFPMRILINCGHTALAVHQKMTNLCKQRFDCIAILDFPSDKQEAQTAFTYRNTALNIDSSRSALYSPDILELDEFRNVELFVPPSGHVAAQYAETDEVAAEWFAPAGLNRAILDTALGLREEYDEDQMTLIASAQINPIINRNGTIVIWEQFTALRKQSAFRNVSLRRLLITVEVSIVDGLDYTIHEPNDDYTAILIIQICVSILQPIKEGRGLYNYAAISDERNNKDYDYNNQQRNVDVIMDPILPIRTIRLTAAVTKKNASFTETVTAINGGSASLGA